MQALGETQDKLGFAGETVTLQQLLGIEINPRAAVMKRLFETHTAAPDKARLVAEQILDNALISAGLLEATTKMVARLYKLLESV